MIYKTLERKKEQGEATNGKIIIGRESSEKKTKFLELLPRIKLSIGMYYVPVKKGEKDVSFA